MLITPCVDAATIRVGRSAFGGTMKDLDMVTINQAAKRIRKATGHDEFTVDNLRDHVESDHQQTVLINGKVYLNRSYIEKLIYALGQAGY